MTAQPGTPLMVDAFEGNRAETKSMIPLIRGFVAAHGIAGVTVVADAGMMSEANLRDVEDAGWSFIVGGKLPEIPYAIAQWGRDNPGREPVAGMILTQPVIMGTQTEQRRRMSYYQFKADRARRTLRGIDPGRQSRESGRRASPDRGGGAAGIDCARRGCRGDVS